MGETEKGREHVDPGLLAQVDDWVARKNERKQIGHVACPRCLRRATVYEGDPRAHGWWRVECPDGHSADVKPEQWKERLDL